MSLLELLIIVIVFALVMWLLAQFVAPALPAPWGKVLLAVVAVLLVLALLAWSGLVPGLTTRVTP